MRRNYLYNPDLKSKARELRNNMTAAERKLWYEYLNQLPVKAHRQKSIQNYIVDFYIPEYKLVIEIDGETHITKSEINYDKKRSEELNYWIRIIRFWNYEIFESMENVQKRIKNAIKKSP